MHSKRTFKAHPLGAAVATLNRPRMAQQLPAINSAPLTPARILFMVIGYARVSTQEQNLDRQLEALGAAGCERIFSERISTRGDWAARPQWGEMWAMLRDGDRLVVHELDRMGRSLRDLLNIVHELEARGVRLVVLSGMFSGQLSGPADSPAAKLATGILLSTAAAFAEYERAVLQSRTMEGLKTARARGRVGGRPHKLTPLEASIVASLYADNTVSVKSICAQFGISPQSVRTYAKKASPPKAAPVLDVSHGQSAPSGAKPKRPKKIPA